MSHFSNDSQNIFMRLISTAYSHLNCICFICTSPSLPHNFFRDSVHNASDDVLIKDPSMDEQALSKIKQPAKLYLILRSFNWKNYILETELNTFL